MKKLIIIGDRAFAEVAYEYFTHDPQHSSPYKVSAFSINKEYIQQKELFGLPIVPFEELEKLYPPANHEVFVAITYNDFNRTRAKLYKEAKEKGYKIASYVSSKAFVWRNVKMGENCFIFENNVVQPFCELGDNVIMWSGNHLGHHSIIKDNCFISSHVVISGYCEIGENTFMGVNSTVADGVKVAKDNFIGAGALIAENTEKDKLYRGTPAVASKTSATRFFKLKRN